MFLISTQTISAPEPALWWLVYYFFLSLVLSTRALGLLGSAMVSIPGDVEEMLRELFLLSRGWIGLFSLSVLVQFCERHLIQYLLTSSSIGLDKEAMFFDGLSEPINTVAVSTSGSAIPLDEFLNVYSPAASWDDEDFDTLSTSSSVPSTLPSLSVGALSPYTPPSSLSVGALSTYGEPTMGYGWGDEPLTFEEYQDDGPFDGYVSDEASTYGDIPRDLYFNGAAAARWNSDAPHPPLAVLVNLDTSHIGSNAESNPSDASSEYELVSRVLYFDRHEAVPGIV